MTQTILRQIKNKNEKQKKTLIPRSPPYPPSPLRGGGVVKWLKHWIRDREFAGSNPGSGGNLLAPILSLWAWAQSLVLRMRQNKRGPVCYRRAHVKELMAAGEKKMLSWGEKKKVEILQSLGIS